MVPALRFVLICMSLLLLLGAGSDGPAPSFSHWLGRPQQTTMMPAFRFVLVFMILISFHLHRLEIGPKSIIATGCSGAAQMGRISGSGHASSGGSPQEAVSRLLVQARSGGSTATRSAPRLRETRRCARALREAASCRFAPGSAYRSAPGTCSIRTITIGKAVRDRAATGT